MPFWPKVSALLQRLHQRNSSTAALAKGMLWGLIPCGLLYGMLVIAATTADVSRGATFMLFFGLGTVLPLMFSQALIRKFIQAGSGLWLRRLSAVFILILGIWVLLAPYVSHQLIPTDNRFFTLCRRKNVLQPMIRMHPFPFEQVLIQEQLILRIRNQHLCHIQGLTDSSHALQM